MTIDNPQLSRLRTVGRFLWRYLELIVAMFLGMLLLDPVWAAILPKATWFEVSDLIMAAQMSFAVGLWMWVRRYGLPVIGEMVLAMVAPFVVLLLPYWAGVLSASAVMMAGHLIMLVGMAVAMLRRREEYLRPRPAVKRRWWGWAGIALLALLTPAAVSAVNTVGAFADLYTVREGQAAVPAKAARPAHDPAKPTVAFLANSVGTIVADLLGPYEVMASTGKINTYVVSPVGGLVPMTGGLDIVPDLTLDELTRLLGERNDALDAVIIPAMETPAPAERQVINTWLRQQSAAGTLTVSVCHGARTLADSGLLDGRPATSHWWRMSKLRADFAAVKWTSGHRYVDDGNVITTAGVLSGIDGALRVTERLLGVDVARQAANAVHWRHFSPGVAATLPVSELEPADVVVALNTSYRPGPTAIGVQLLDGVGELELASAFVSYPEEAMVGDTVAIGDGPIRSQHGLTFVPRSTALAATGDLDRFLVPGLRAAQRQAMGSAPGAATAGLEPEYLHRAEEFAFDPVLRDIDATWDMQTARWTAKTLEYPASDLKLTGSDWPWEATLTFVRLMLLGALIGVAVGAALRRIGRARGRSAASESLDSPDDDRDPAMPPDNPADRDPAEPPDSRNDRDPAEPQPGSQRHDGNRSNVG